MNKHMPLPLLMNVNSIIVYNEVISLFVKDIIV